MLFELALPGARLVACTAVAHVAANGTIIASKGHGTLPTISRAEPLFRSAWKHRRVSVLPALTSVNPNFDNTDPVAAKADHADNA